MSKAAADALSCFGTSFAQYERAFREQLGDMFAPGGFDPRRDIAGIILNRWGHAYVNPQPGFFFGLGGKLTREEVEALAESIPDGSCTQELLRLSRDHGMTTHLSTRLVNMQVIDRKHSPSE